VAAVCVFCSSSLAIDPQHVALAADLGRLIAARGHTLVSGGGRISMMGAVARAAREGGAHTLGVIPEGLVGLEVADDDADELVVTPGMRERKALMDARSDAFVVLPGGLGTLEELLEVWVARSLGMHDKPVVVCDPTGLLDPLERMVDHLEDAGFVRRSAREALLWARSPQEALDLVETHLGREPHLRPGAEVVE
jgi:uncharacterized protein (TIGR00730 family)